jgi:hypothetical protein
VLYPEARVPNSPEPWTPAPVAILDLVGGSNEGKVVEL